MALVKKTLWIVDIKTEAAEKMFAKHALAVSATAVCIRTSSSRLRGAIDRFHKIGMEVYGWRWPSALQSAALAEANKVAQNLIPAGLDGYIVDPESDGPGNNDWNNPKKDLGPLAKQFCDTIRKAAGKNFVFGTTSGCAYPSAGGKPHIPFKEFFAASDILLPQTYWRWTHFDQNKKKDVVEGINGGTPAKSIKRGLAAWKPKAGSKMIVPMAGEVDVVTPQEIADYGAELAKLGVAEGHFYTDNGKIPVPVLAAIKAL